jgi:hypothetical protein
VSLHTLFWTVFPEISVIYALAQVDSAVGIPKLVSLSYLFLPKGVPFRAFPFYAFALALVEQLCDDTSTEWTHEQGDR